MTTFVDFIKSSWYSTRVYIFNLREKIYHQPYKDEENIIKKTHLFDKMTSMEFNKMLKKVQFIKYPKGSLILQENSQGGDIFVIVDGVARVFTKDLTGAKINIKKLYSGEFFGEQALLGKANKIRNAYVEAAEEVTLIKINEHYLSDLLNKDVILKESLEEKRFKQAVNILSLTAGLYNDIEAMLANIDKPEINEFRNNEYIFKYGDKAEKVYLVLQGKVKLLIPNQESNRFSIVMLNRGQIFGELGVIKNAPRAATAIAHSNLRLLGIEGEYFKKHISNNPQLMKVMQTLQKTYQLPLRGTVEQYVGNVQGMGNSITNIYKLADGKIAVSAKILDQDIFTMSLVNVSPQIRYSYKKGLNRIELEVENNCLVGIYAYGLWNSLPILCQYLLDQESIDEYSLEKFEVTGGLN